MPTSVDLQFEDGDIILALPGRRYRVHKSVLSAQSRVFADMLTTPIATNGGKSGVSEDGIPVVQLQDRPEPFTLFLHVLYNNDLEPHFPKLAKNTTFLVSGILDLMDKYSVSQIDMRTKLFPFVERDWPSTLAAWDDNEAFISQLSTTLEKAGKLDLLDEKLPEPASLVRFAHAYTLSGLRSHKIPKYVPAAFYHLARLPPYADPDDITLNGEDLDDGMRTAKRLLLSHQDFVCLQHGIYNLRLAAANISFVGFYSAAENVDGVKDSERAVMIDWWRKAGIERLLGPERLDLLADMRVLIRALEGDTGYPGLLQGTGVLYRKAMQEYLENQREHIWATLDQMFNLHSSFY